MVGHKFIVLDQSVLGDMSLYNAVVPLGDGDLDRVLTSFGRVADSVDSGFLKVVVFAVVTYGNKVVVVEKGGETVLGFGKGCRGISKFSLCRSSMLEQLYEELDCYIPGKAYGVIPIGAVYSDHREYDAGSVGFLFRVVLRRSLRARKVVGKACRVCMRGLEEIERVDLHGWSRLIYDVLSLRVRMGVPR